MRLSGRALARRPGACLGAGALLAVALGSTSAWASDPRPGIVGGEPTSGDAAVVALATEDPCGGGLEVYCTGTIVSPRVVLTAAHCVQQPTELVRVFVGSDASGGQGRWLSAAALRIHPDFDKLDYSNDIGAVILGEDIGIDSMPLATATVVPGAEGAAARIVGFGVPEPGGGEVGIKRTGQVRVSLVHETTFETVPDPAMSCQVDSGGPVLLVNGDGVEVLAGITSNGDAFCEELAVNTRVDAYLGEFLAGVFQEAGAGTLMVPPPLGPEACQGCSVLGCGDGETCDPDTDECVPETLEATGGEGGCCSVAGLGPSPLATLLLLVTVLSRRRRRAGGST